MAARMKGRLDERVRARGPAPAQDVDGSERAPEASRTPVLARAGDPPPNPVSVAARLMALHRWRKPYGECAGQMAIAIVFEDGGGFTPDPEEAGDG